MLPIASVLLKLFFLILCLLMTVIILAQTSKGGGLAGVLSGQSSDAMFNPATRNPLRRITSVLVVIFFLCCIGISVIDKKQHGAPEARKQEQKEAPKKDQPAPEKESS